MNPNHERLTTILLAPHVSEKASGLAERANQYVFKVRRDASKDEIAAAVELMFEVQVANVTVSNTRGKLKRFGQALGRRGDWKKAYVRLAEGQNLNVLGVE